MTGLAQMAFELRYSIEGSRVTGQDERGKDVWKKDPDRAKLLALIPTGFKRLVGSYQEVMHEATRLNAVQQRAKFLDYLYFPDPVNSKPVTKAETGAL